jgi:hypothetical protein
MIYWNFYLLKEYENLSIVRKNKNSGISLHWSNEPYLVSIEQNHKSLDEEDAKLKLENSLNIYPLKEGKTIINGQGEGDLLMNLDDSAIEIDLSDSNVRKNHCCLDKLESKVFVQPINGSVQVNNRVYEPGIGQIELCSGDFLIVGDLYLFQYQNPTEMAEKMDVKPKGQINLVKLFKMLLLDSSDTDKPSRGTLLKVRKIT